MSTIHYCPNCMLAKPAYRILCPTCGFDERAYVPAPETLLPDTVLDGKYVIGKVLGQGGFGITYLGLDRVLGRKVAIKEYFVSKMSTRDSRASSVVTTTVLSQDEYRLYTGNFQKFYQEARILAGLGPMPGIVRVHDLFDENDTAYFVMEYLPGMHLKQYVLSRGGKITWQEAVNILLPVMRSLQYVHRRGIIHRDISPDNLVFHADGRIRLVDFGGARIMSKQQVTTFALIKNGYSPYELMTGKTSQGPWTDTYSLTAVLYYCLCGHPPVSAKIGATGEEMAACLSAEVPLTSRQRQVIAKGLSERPANRYLTMDVFAHDILSVSQGKQGSI